MKRALLLAVLALAACKKKTADAPAAQTCPPRADHSVTLAISALPVSLDWNKSHEASFQNYPVLHAMMRGLTRLDSTFQPQPQLAESWEVRDAPPRQIYVFHLKQGITWSDGKTPLRAQDFVFGWRRAVQGADSAELADLEGADAVLAAMKKGGEGLQQAVDHVGVRALDDATLEVTLKGPRSYFLNRVAYVYPYFPAPSAELQGKSEDEVHRYFDEPRDGRPLVLGAFQVAKWDRVAQTVELVANPHDAWKPKSGVVEKLRLMQADLSPLMYEQCQIDFLYLDDPTALSKPPPDMQTARLLSTYWLGFNTTKMPLALRQAIGHAVDRAALMKALAQSIPTPRVAKGYLPPEMPGAPRDAELEGLPTFDLEKAKAEVKASGYAGEELTLLVRTSGTFMPETGLAEGLRRQLEAAGVKVKLVSSANLVNDLKEADGQTLRHHMFLKRTGADYAHPHTLLTIFQNGGNNYTDWQKLDGGKVVGAFEQLLAEGAAAKTAEMSGVYARAERMLIADQAVALPLYYPNRYYRKRPWLEGLAIDPFNFLTFAEMRVSTP